MVGPDQVASSFNINLIVGDSVYGCSNKEVRKSKCGKTSYQTDFQFFFYLFIYFLKFRVPFFKENSRLYNNVFNYWRYYMSKLRFCWGGEVGVFLEGSRAS